MNIKGYCDIKKLTKNKKVLSLYQTNDIDIYIYDNNNYWIEKCRTDTVFDIVTKILNNNKGKLTKFI